MVFFSTFVTFLPDFCVIKGGSIVLPLKYRKEQLGSDNIFKNQVVVLL